MITLKFKRLNETAELPAAMTGGAACFDFKVNRIQYTEEHKVIAFLGLACEIPEGYSMSLMPRSSFTHKGWVVANTPGQIDSDYRGELQVRFEAIPNYVHNGTRIFLEYPEFPYKLGDRCIQGKLERVIPVTFEDVEELSDTKRSGGFGSTGK